MESGAYTALKTAPDVNERKIRKVSIAQQVRDEHGLDMALCAEALDILEIALYGAKSASAAYPHAPGSSTQTSSTAYAPQYSMGMSPVQQKKQRYGLIATIAVVVAIAGIAIGVVSSGKKAEQVEAHFNTGNGFFSQGDDDAALEEFTEALRLNPKYAPAYFMRGIVYTNKGDHNRAIVDYDEAIRLNPKYTEFAVFHYMLGWTYSNKGDYNRAIADYDKAIRLNPQYAQAYYGRGVAYDTIFDFARAMENYNEAIRLNQQFGEAYYNRGRLHFNNGDYNRAVEDFEAASRLLPNSADARNNLALSRRARGW
jgi:tetratricopeptide (TPR) repeat protein